MRCFVSSSRHEIRVASQIFLLHKARCSANAILREPTIGSYLKLNKQFLQAPIFLRMHQKGKYSYRDVGFSYKDHSTKCMPAIWRKSRTSTLAMRMLKVLSCFVEVSISNLAHSLDESLLRFVSKTLTRNAEDCEEVPTKNHHVPLQPCTLSMIHVESSFLGHMRLSLGCSWINVALCTSNLCSLSLCHEMSIVVPALRFSRTKATKSSTAVGQAPSSLHHSRFSPSPSFVFATSSQNWFQRSLFTGRLFFPL